MPNPDLKALAERAVEAEKWFLAHDDWTDEEFEENHTRPLEAYDEAFQPETVLALIEKLEAMEKALRPFAKVGWLNWESEHSDLTVVARIHVDQAREIQLSTGDFRAALAAISEHGQFATSPGWQIFECDDSFYSFAADNPTHWRPLPDPPESESTPS